MSRGPLLAGAVVAVAVVAAVHFAPGTLLGPATVVVDVSRRHQTILGWEATSQLGQTEIPHSVHYAEEVLDRTANELGIDRIRLEIRSGTENPRDGFAEMFAGQIDYDTFRPLRYDVVNDDDDPRTIRPEGFRFTEVDQAVDTLVNPLRERLEARGEELYVSLCFVDFQASGFRHDEHPEEYAEFVLATFLHLRERYGWVPDAVEIILEPDVADGWPPEALGPALVATGRRLDEAGFHPDFVAPSTTSMKEALTYLDAILETPGADAYLTDLCYHRYWGVTRDTLARIARRAGELGLRTAQLEKMGASARELFDDLTIGNVSSWSQYAIAWVTSSGDDDGGKYFLVDDSDPERPVVHEGKRTRYLRQVFRHVRRGAVRVDASTDMHNVRPAAFVREDGGVVLAVFSRDGNSFHAAGLPAGTYAVTYATADEADGELPDVVVADGEQVLVEIPAAGVITLRAR